MTMRLQWRLLPGCMLAWCSVAFAQTEASSGAQLPSMLSVFGSLILVIAAIYASVWGIKKLGQLPGSSGNVVKIIGGVMVGPKERVVVVEVEGQKLVLGVANGAVNLLTKVSSPTQFEHALELAESRDQQPDNAARPDLAADKEC